MKKDSIWIVTDLDGTLMDKNYDIEPAINTLKLIIKEGITLIPCTSKTAAEVEIFQDRLSLSSPYIVENGGAIYGINKSLYGISEYALGRTHDELKPFLFKFSKEIDEELLAFEDLSNSEITELTGLKGSEIKLATARLWSVPFLSPSKKGLKKLKEISLIHGLNIVQGNKMVHLIDKRSGKGEAIKKLKVIMKKPNVQIIGLGDSPNDRSLLEIANISIVVPGPQGPNNCFINEIESGKFILAPAPNAKGWSQAVEMILRQKLIG